MPYSASRMFTVAGIELCLKFCRQNFSLCTPFYPGKWKSCENLMRAEFSLRKSVMSLSLGQIYLLSCIQTTQPITALKLNKLNNSTREGSTKALSVFSFPELEETSALLILICSVGGEVHWTHEILKRNGFLSRVNRSRFNHIIRWNR